MSENFSETAKADEHSADASVSETVRCGAHCAQGSRCTMEHGHAEPHAGEDGCTFYNVKPTGVEQTGLPVCPHCLGAVPPFVDRCPCHPDNPAKVVAKADAT